MTSRKKSRPRRVVRPLVEARRATAREEVLRAARECLLADGPAATIASVAKRLGITKPAVYYYFPSRAALFRELAVAAIERESDALTRAAQTAESASDAVTSFVKTCIRHHIQNLDDFRLIYAMMQVLPVEMLEGEIDAFRQSIYPKTDRAYSALEVRLTEAQQAGEIAADVHPRRLAVAAHLAAIGFVCMYGMSNAKGDPLKHDFGDLIDELIQLVTRGLKETRAPASRLRSS